MEDLVAGARLEDGHRLEGGERDVLGARVGEAHVLEGDRAPSPGDVDRVGVLLNHGDDVEDLEEALERDEGGHHIEVDVGELGQRPVQAGQVGGEGDQGAEGERAVDGGHAAEAVDERGGQGPGQREGRRRRCASRWPARCRCRGPAPPWPRTRSASASGCPSSLTSMAPPTWKRSCMTMFISLLRL